MSTLILAFCSLIVIVLVKLCKIYVARQEFLKKIVWLPGPKPLPILGNALEFKNLFGLLPAFLNYAKIYGPSFKLHLGPRIVVITSDPKLIEFITTSNTQLKKGFSYRFIHNWLGTGLLTADNPKWKSHRKILTPTFHFKILEKYIPIFHSNALNLKQHFSKSIGKDCDIYEDVVLSSLDVIGETTMGFSINALKEGNSSNYVESVKYMGKTVAERTFSSWRQFDFLHKNSPAYKKEKQCVDFLHNTTNKIIQAKRFELQNKNHEQKDDDGLYGKQKFAFLDMLLRCSTDEGGTLSDYDIRQEVDTFMFAGHDTVASALSFTLYLLSKNENVQDKVYEEIKRVFGNDLIPNMEGLNELKYLEMVIKESMRLYPPVPIVVRELTEDVTFSAKLFPKGVAIFISPYIVHRNPDIYPDPEKFDPDRFATEECAKRSIYSFIPFSAGLRNCIGQKFAMLEMKTMLCSILKEYKLLKVPNFEIVLVPETVLKSVNGVYVHIEKR